MVEISTSILSVEENETEVFINLEKAKTDYIHIDVMDGQFVEKDTYTKMLKYSSAIRRVSNVPLDVHLMVNDIEKAIDEFADVNPNIITFHYEACKNREEVMKYIKMIKDRHCRVGISVKPNTPIENIYEFLPYIHVCLIMTVEPGKGGQTLLVDMVEKISTLKKYIETQKLEVEIEADGGINLRTAESVKKAGANMLVSGTAILRAVDFGEIIKELKK